MHIDNRESEWIFNSEGAIRVSQIVVVVNAGDNGVAFKMVDGSQVNFKNLSFNRFIDCIRGKGSH